MIKIVTWNVNSIRVRIGALQKLAKDEKPDVVCLQEIKAKKEDFPWEEVKNLGFENIALYCMPGYNGVAILSRLPLKDVKEYSHVGKNDARHISAVVNGKAEIHNIYIPAGGDIPDVSENPSFKYKLDFISELAEFFEKNKAEKRIVCGDFNVAPLENDVWNHKAMLKIVSHTPVEISKLTKFYQDGGFEDMVRHKYPEPQKIYSWWSYRNPNWKINNKGRRLDHLWCSPELVDKIKKVEIYKNFRSYERPSDHVPVAVELEI